LNYELDPRNLETPITQKMENIFFAINQGGKLSKSVDMYLRESVLDSFESFSDSGKNNKRTVFTVDQLLEDQIYVPSVKDQDEYLEI